MAPLEVAVTIAGMAREVERGLGDEVAGIGQDQLLEFVALFLRRSGADEHAVAA